MFDVVAIGELLIDFTPSGNNQEGIALFAQNPGGAPGNVLSLLAKLGKKTALISKVGKDQFGHYLIEVMKNSSVETQGIIQSADANTTLAFVHLNKDGDRSFSFYRKNGADMMLCKEEIPQELLRKSTIFHFGSVSLTDEPVRTATFFAVEQAKKNGALISYDPNLRPLLWKSLGEAKKLILQGLPFADILKISEEELEFLTGSNDLERATRKLAADFSIPVILVTLGAKGAFFNIHEKTGIASTYDVKTVDTTGAGDAFFAAFLFQLLENNGTLDTLHKSELLTIIDFANAAGSLATTKKGAIPAMPTLPEIETCQKTIKKLVL